MVGVDEAAAQPSPAPALARPEKISPAARQPSWLRVSWVSASAALVTAVLTAALSVLCYQLNRHNEHRLLELQVKQTATVLQTILPGVETPLASAAEIAMSHPGSASSFDSYMKGYVGASPKPFVGAALYRQQGGQPLQIGAAGQPLALSNVSGGQGPADDLTGLPKGEVVIVGPLAVQTARPRVGYAYTASGYIVYAEVQLPPNRHVVIKPGSAFGDLRFAIYVGRRPIQQHLLETNVDRLPVSGDTATDSVDFGASTLTLVAGTNRALGGGLSGSLWWIVIVVGVVLTALIAMTTEWLVRRRRQAEGLTAQTELQLAEQRTLAHMVQRALLPESILTPPGLAADARYIAGVAGVDIGGDWYDLVPLADQRAFLAIGDVSGRGVRAGTTMAALRFAIRAFVSEGHRPAEVLRRLAVMLDVGRDKHFATVLCAILDSSTRELTAANAGHLSPLVVSADGSQYLDIPAEPPIGVQPPTSYREVTIALPSEGTLLTFTDGLIERPGETLDVSLERLRSVMTGAASLADVFDRVMPRLSTDSRDDIAILGVQWPS